MNAALPFSLSREIGVLGIALRVRRLMRIVWLVVPTVPALVAGPGVMAAGTAVAEPQPALEADVVRFEPLDPSGGPMSALGRPYRGSIEIRRAGGGLAVINEVALEDYVRGIAEVPPDWPPAAQQAQAIAARTYALNQKEADSGGPWRAAGADICATAACQVYEGVAGEQRPSGANWTDAVTATAGQVLLVGDRPILAMYSSSNGGRSVRGPASYLPSVPDRDDARSPLSRWVRQIPLAGLAPLLDVKAPATLVGVRRSGDAVVLSEQVPDQPVSERAVPVGDFVEKAGGTGSGAGAFPSFRFSLRTEGGAAVAEGQGFGHGIGMSQYGAYGKALRGLDAADILASYYGGVRPSTLPTESLPVIRVAVALDQRSVRVSTPTYFRVADGAGAALAGIGRGEWTVTAAGGGVRVVPPESHSEPLAITSPVVEAAPAGGGPAAVRFDMSAPATVTASLSTPGRSPNVVPARLVDAGPATLELPPFDLGETYHLVIQADAGPGRQASVPLRMEVPDDTTATVFLRPVVAEPRQGWVLAALLALAGALVNARVCRMALAGGRR